MLGETENKSLAKNIMMNMIGFLKQNFFLPSKHFFCFGIYNLCVCVCDLK